MSGKNSREKEGKGGEIDLGCMSKKLLNVVQLQILDIENSLHYIQKKRTLLQTKESLSQIYHIFNETQPLFEELRAQFLHQLMSKLMNCFGIIYITMMDYIDRGNK